MDNNFRIWTRDPDRTVHLYPANQCWALPKHKIKPPYIVFIVEGEPSPLKLLPPQLVFWHFSILMALYCFFISYLKISIISECLSSTGTIRYLAFFSNLQTLKSCTCVVRKMIQKVEFYCQGDQEPKKFASWLNYINVILIKQCNGWTLLLKKLCQAGGD